MRLDSDIRSSQNEEDPVDARGEDLPPVWWKPPADTPSSSSGKYRWIYNRSSESGTVYWGQYNVPTEGLKMFKKCKTEYEASKALVTGLRQYQNLLSFKLPDQPTLPVWVVLTQTCPTCNKEFPSDRYFTLMRAKNANDSMLQC